MDRRKLMEIENDLLIKGLTDSELNTTCLHGIYLEGEVLQLIKTSENLRTDFLIVDNDFTPEIVDIIKNNEKYTVYKLNPFDKCCVQHAFKTNYNSIVKEHLHEYHFTKKNIGDTEYFICVLIKKRRD